jgi:hypothetical protein
MADLVQIGKILALVDGIIIIIFSILGLIGQSLNIMLNLGVLGDLGIVGVIISIIAGLFMINVYIQKVKIPLVGLLLAIVVLVVAFFFTTLIGVVAGIILLIAHFVK